MRQPLIYNNTLNSKAKGEANDGGNETFLGVMLSRRISWFTWLRIKNRGQRPRPDKECATHGQQV